MTYVLRTQGTSRYFLFLFLCVEPGTFPCTFNILTPKEYWEPQDTVLSYVPLTLFGNSDTSELWYSATSDIQILSLQEILMLWEFWQLRNSDTSRTLTPLFCTGPIVHQGSHTWIIILYWTCRTLVYFKDLDLVLDILYFKDPVLQWSCTRTEDALLFGIFNHLKTLRPCFL